MNHRHLQLRMSLLVLTIAAGMPLAAPADPEERLIEVVPVPVGRTAEIEGYVPDPAPRPRGTVRITPPPREESGGAPRRASRDSKVDPPSARGVSGRVRDKRVRDTRVSNERVRDKRVRDPVGRPPVVDKRDRDPDGSPNVEKRDGAKLPADFAYGVRQEDRRRGALGPAAAQVDLLAGWRPDPDVPLGEEDVVPFPRVFRDRNEASGIFYFQPASYQLAWDAHDGYALRILYQAAGVGGRGRVLMSMTLDAGVEAYEVELARQLLRAQAARGAVPAFEDLTRIPIDAAPTVELGADLEHLFDIPADSVRAAGVSDPLGRLEVALATDSVTKENLQLALFEGRGLAGRVLLEPAGEALGSQAIPFSIDPSSRRNFPRVDWSPGELWRNRLPYPVRLRYLHVLRLVGGRPVVYSWSLEETVVPRRARLKVDSAPLPDYLVNGALRIWLDYRVEDGCAECREDVLATVTSGVSAVASDEVVFRTLTPLADSGAVELLVEVRSRYFHPRERRLETKPELVVDRDGESYTLGPIYPPDRAGSAEGPLFEYRLRLVLPDGTVRASERWQPADSLYQPLGTVQVEAAVGSLTGAVAAEEPRR